MKEAYSFATIGFREVVDSDCVLSHEATNRTDGSVDIGENIGYALVGTGTGVPFVHLCEAIKAVWEHIYNVDNAPKCPGAEEALLRVACHYLKSCAEPEQKKKKQN